MLFKPNLTEHVTYNKCQERCSFYLDPWHSLFKDVTVSEQSFFTLSVIISAILSTVEYCILLFWMPAMDVILLHFQVIWVRICPTKPASKVLSCITTCSCDILSSKHFTRCLLWRFNILLCTLLVKSGMCFFLCSGYEFTNSICYVIYRSHTEGLLLSLVLNVLFASCLEMDKMLLLLWPRAKFILLGAVLFWHPE